MFYIFYLLYEVKLKCFYYPGGASDDFVCKYTNMKECVKNALKSTFEYTEIYGIQFFF